MTAEARGLAATTAARVGLLGIPLLALLAYANTFDNGFTIYDPELFLDNPQVRSLANIPGYFVDSQWGGTDQWGFYRPLTMITHALDYAFFGQAVAPMRAVNIALHGLNGVLVAYLAFRLGHDRWIALLAGAVFVLHPVQTEAVNQIATRSDLLATGFFLLGFLAYLRDAERRHAGMYRALIAPVAYLAGLLSKEMAVTLPACLVLHDLLFDRPSHARQWLVRIGPFVVVGLIYAVCHLSIVPSGSIRFFATDSRWVVVLTMAKVFAVYLRLLVLPIDLSITYAPHVIPKAHALLDPGVLPALALHAAMAALAFVWRRRAPVVAFAILYFYLTLAPVSHLAVSTPTLAGERFLYPGTFSFALAFGWLGTRAYQRLGGMARSVGSVRVLRGVLCGSVMMVGLSHLALTSLRNEDWQDQLEIWRAAARTYPNCIQAAIGFGNELAARGQLDEAQREYERAVALAPTDSRLRFELAIIKQRRGDEAGARAVLEAASRATPGDPNVERVLGLMLLRSGRVRDADAAFARAIAAMHGRRAPLLDLARRLRQLGFLELAEHAERQAK